MDIDSVYEYMRHLLFLLTFVTFAFGPRKSFAQPAFRTADIDSAGELHIVLANGRVISPPREADQVAVKQVALSADHRVVGWLALYPNCCTTYPIALKLVLLRAGGRRTVIGNELPIWQWAFTDDGRSVVIRQSAVHGDRPTYYERRDVRTGRVISTAVHDSNTALPAWACSVLPTNGAPGCLQQH